VAGNDGMVAPKKRRPFYYDLSFQVLAGMVLGIAMGWLYPHAATTMKPLGDAFIRLIQMVIGPIIFCTVVHGIAGVRDLKKVGRIAIKALIYFEVVTSLALIIGLVVTNLLQPGAGMNIDPTTLDSASVQVFANQAKHVVSISEFLLDVIPASAINGFARGDILQILFFSVLFACGLTAIGEAGRPVVDVIGGASKALFWIVGLAMKFAPLAAFGAMAFTVGQFGFASLLSLGKLIVVFYLICAIFFAIILLPVTVWARFSLWKLMRYIGEELLLVLGTSSSETVFPQLTRKLRRLGCDESVVGLVLPTAYTFNHDGTCLYFAAATVFLAQATNTPTDWQHQLGLLAILLLTSKGAAGVSGSALVVLAVTLAANDTIPVSSIALILGIHRILSAAFVFTNIAGNSVATIVVAYWESALDRNRLDAELDAGYQPSAPAELAAESLSPSASRALPI
jgi:aerobic C4-dicarboxylate transport protein